MDLLSAVGLSREGALLAVAAGLLAAFALAAIRRLRRDGSDTALHLDDR